MNDSDAISNIGAFPAKQTASLRPRGNAIGERGSLRCSNEKDVRSKA